MAETDTILTQKVKRSGVFDFKDLYQMVYRWYVDEGYDVEEEKYQENVSGDAKDIEIEWGTEKKISDYFKIKMKLTWRIIRMTDVEVDRGGRKEKMNKGNFEIKIRGDLVRDWDSKWDKSWMTKFFRGIYDKYIIWGNRKQYEGKVASDVDDITEQIKAFLTISGMK